LPQTEEKMGKLKKRWK